MTLKEQVQKAIDYCNQQLSDKGVKDVAVSVIDIGNKIKSIETSQGVSLDNVDVYIADYADSTTIAITAGAVDKYSRVIIS